MVGRVQLLLSSLSLSLSRCSADAAPHKVLEPLETVLPNSAGSWGKFRFFAPKTLQREQLVRERELERQRLMLRLLVAPCI